MLAGKLCGVLNHFKRRMLGQGVAAEPRLTVRRRGLCQGLAVLVSKSPSPSVKVEGVA